MNNIVYSWNFNPLEIVYNEETLTNVVTVVHWQYVATHVSASQQSIGTVSLDTPSAEAFIPFESLTKEMLVDWVEAKLGESTITQMQNTLSQSLNNIIFPKSGQVAPPWTS